MTALATFHRPAEALTLQPLGLEALLAIPPDACGLVIFAHGSGSGRLSPRNNQVADGLHEHGLATLLLDLLSPAEETDRRNVFDIALLASRLQSASGWAAFDRRVQNLPVAYFGASTGAGAAILAAAGLGDTVKSVVSRGGRIDLAGMHALSSLRAPLQVIVGSIDLPVLDLSRTAMPLIRCEKELIVIPGAGHLFEEHGTLEQVIEHASRWFLTHFPRRAHSA